MLGLILGAVRARAAQAAILFGLTALAVAATSAAPWYVISTARSVALTQVANAQPGFLVARARGTVPLSPGGQSGAALVSRARAEGGAVVSVPGASSAAGVWLPGTATGPGGPSRLSIAHREKLCVHLVIEGACPAGPGEAVVSRRTAELLAAGVGARVSFGTDQIGVVPLRVVGVYQLGDPLEAYWSLSELGASSGGANVADAGDPVFVAADTMAGLPVEELPAEYHLVLAHRAFLGAGGYDVGAELRAQIGTAGGAWRVASSAPQLADRVDREQRLLYYGVAVAATQLLLFCWVALFIAVRHTAEQRRPDVGLVKLRGGTLWRLWSLVVAQSGLPMSAGAVLGAAGGVAVARLLAGGIGDADQVRLAVTLSVAGTLAAIAGALLAALLADGPAMGATVPDLLRHVPARRRGWRADAVDLAIVAVAGAGVYQAYAAAGTSTADAGRGQATGVGLLAPALVAVVVALLAARLIAPLAAVIGRHALRAGRLPAALTATHLARRPGTHRVFALLTVATALLVTAVSGWQTAAEAGGRRAAQELGAERVLTVQARSRTHLLAAVRAADPSGAGAMAVVRNNSAPTMLAVDSARFARVATDQQAYRPPGTRDLAGLLRPAAPAPVGVPDGTLTLEAAGSGVDRPLTLLAHLAAGDGDPVTVAFGPLGGGRAGHPASVTGCGDAGCRLIGFELVGPTPSGGSAPAPPDSRAEIYGLTGAAGPVLSAALLGDAGRWRPSVLDQMLVPTVAPYQGHLTLIAPGSPSGPAVARSTLAHLIDAPMPVPVLRTGPPPETVIGDPRLTLFGGHEVPVRFLGMTEALPGVTGSAYLVDLEYADRVAAPGGLGDVLQVWLGPRAPAGLPDRLREQGLQILATDSAAAARDRLDRRGPPSALRFQVATALIGLLLGAGALTLVAAVERPDRAAELAALRAQGLPAGTARRVAYGGQLLLAGTAVLLGVAVAVLAALAVPAAMPVFVDNWRVLPLPAGPGPVPVLLAGLTGLLVFGTAGAASAARLVRAAGWRAGPDPGRPGRAGGGPGTVDPDGRGRP